MKRPATRAAHPRPSRARVRRGFTLVEVLTATVLTLILMFAVVTVFAMMGENVNYARDTLEMTDRLRAAKMQLQRDLEGVTVTVSPPRRPEAGEGYLMLKEGPVGPIVPIGNVAFNTLDPGNPADTTVEDSDDILALTVHSDGQPFVGRAAVKRAPVPPETALGTDSRGAFVFDRVITIESQIAEIIYFVRGRTLYRRMLVIQPHLGVDLDERTIALDLPPADGFYAVCDLSVHYDTVAGTLVPNTLSDLTRPECRFANNPDPTVFPSHPHQTQPWGGVVTPGAPPQWHPGLGLPTLCECSDASWVAGAALPALTLTQSGDFDAWLNPHPWEELDRTTGAHQTYYVPANVPRTQRVAEDVLLTNVVGFNVEVLDPWAPVVLDNSGTRALEPGDPGYLAAVQAVITGARQPISFGAYVDLNYMCRLGPESSPTIPGFPEPAYRDRILTPPLLPEPHFYGAGRPRSGLRGTEPTSTYPPPAAQIRPSIYDTWSFHYEHDGENQDNDGLRDEGTNGFDDPVDISNPWHPHGTPSGVSNGLVDEPDELETSPPYPFPLRGIRIRIRVFEPDSRQVRAVTIKHDFLPK